MNVLSEFLIIALSAAVLQNAVFTRGLGSSRDTLMMGAPRRIFAFGAALTFITVVSAALAWPLNRLLREQQLSTRLGIRYLTSISTLACVCAVFTLLYLVTRAWFPRIHYPLRRDAAASPCPTCPAPSAGCPSCCSISESSPWRSMG